MSTALLADCYHDLGSKWYYKRWLKKRDTKNLQNAINVTQKALSIKQSIDTLDHSSFQKTLYNLGYFNYRNKNFFEGIRAYSDLVNNYENGSKTLLAYRELGKLYNEIGDFHKAIVCFEKVISAYDDNPLHTNRLIAYIELANTYSLMGYKEYSDQIANNLKKANTILDKKELKSNVYKNRIFQIEGNRLLEIEEYEKALIYQRQILETIDEKDSVNRSIVHNSLGISYLNLSDFDNTALHLEKAIAYNPKNSGPYNNFGDYFIRQKRYKEALQYYQKAIHFSTGKSSTINYEHLPSIKDLEIVPNKVVLLNHIVTKANGWLQYYEFERNTSHLEQALQTFRLADELVDVIRSESTEYQSKLFWRAQGAKLYMKAVEACYILKKHREAYYFMERNKALLLLEDISGEEAKEIAKLPENIAKREYELKQAILWSENELQNAIIQSKNNLDSLKNDIYRLKSNYSNFVDSLRIEFPEYIALKRDVKLLPYTSFQKRYVTENQMVLQYILNANQGYGLLQTSTESMFFELKNVETLNNKISRLYLMLSNLVWDTKKTTSFNRVSNDVFNQLIPDNIYKKIKGKKLTVIPDYTLQKIPFEALVVDREKEEYLIENTEVRYAYSMSYLGVKQHVKHSAKKMYLGLAPVQFEKLGLRELNFSESEVKEVNNIYSGNLLLGNEATKSRWLNNMYNYKVIHLSSHADVTDSEDHWIAFADEKMYLNEIYAAKNQADMVVLSACNTSVGEVQQGEGVLSIARGFFHSGAKSMVSSLWTINDKISKDLIVDFYNGLDQGLTKSEALRASKLTFLNKYKNSVPPSYWAALIVIGDNAPITNSNAFFTYCFLIVVPLLIVIVWLIRRRKANL
ncbi:CHAT domain-containing protein [Aquimarina sp. D1M17]|uniref:CHAT domain-containing protein n=1 Tax=Aquimarina acroporae TaxID=2937283 RepID=UPI0020C11942|nr:CHAT domain-containing protein [Aquimarina acroporae]MCK8521355.1 CHAT domain-containing protein [Aquimarina acroporae]